MHCKKMLVLDMPPGGIATEQVFNQDTAAIAAVSHIYYVMAQGAQFMQGAHTVSLGLLTDELRCVGVTATKADGEYFSGQVQPGNSVLATMWGDPYKAIVLANTVLEKLGQSTGVRTGLKLQLMGEAKFLRAYNYFMLVNLFGGVPKVIGLDFKENARLPRASVADIYELIIKDLVEASKQMEPFPAGGVKREPKRVRAYNTAATALLARVYLFRHNFDRAVLLADELIRSGYYQLAARQAAIGMADSEETIWALWPAIDGFGTGEARRFIPFTAGAMPAYAVSDNMMDGFETGDHRKAAWLRYFMQANEQGYYPVKYRQNKWPAEEAHCVMRLAEIWLIRAEARAKLGRLEGDRGAVMDVNVIRSRAGLPPLPDGLTQYEVLVAIEQERRVELLAEGGHRWFDLKRMVNIQTYKYRLEEVMSSCKTGWRPYQSLLPVPAAELTLNPALVQNPGYE